MSFTVWVELEVIPERVDEFLKAIAINQAATLNEPGCIYFDVMKLEREGQWFAFYEIYRDEKAFYEEHRTYEHYLEWREAVKQTVVPGSQTITAGNLNSVSAHQGSAVEKVAKVFRPATMHSVDRGNGAKTIPLVCVKSGAETFLNGMTIFAPNAQIAHHSHNTAESVMVIEGRAIVNINGEEFELDTYDTTFVPANIAHHFRNASDSKEMRIFWTYESIDATRTIIESGVTQRIDQELGG